MLQAHNKQQKNQRLDGNRTDPLEVIIGFLRKAATNNSRMLQGAMQGRHPENKARTGTVSGP